VPEELRLVADEAATCTRCALAETRTQVVFGVGDPGADLLFVGEGPGAEEDRLGQPFVGRSGKLLDQLVLEEMGLTREQFYIANVVKCRPPGNRDPLPDEIAACNPWLERQIELIAPRVVITLGNFATKTLLQTKEGITKVRGRTYPFRGGVLIPTFHPAAILRGGATQMAQMRADLVRAKHAIAEAAAGGAVELDVAEEPPPVAPAAADATLFD
jgi:DNA polymerase